MARDSWHSPFPSIVGPMKTPRQLQREERHRRNVTLAAQNSPPQNNQVTEEQSPPEDTLSTSSRPFPPARRQIDHFVMNLPGTAIEFLDAFRGCLSAIKDEPGFSETYRTMPLVHCHSFTRELEPDRAKADLRQVWVLELTWHASHSFHLPSGQRAENALGGTIAGDIEYHFVRSVAPNKDMWCITFTLPRDLALSWIC